MTKKTALEQFEQNIETRFLHTDQRFDKMDQKFDQMDQKFDQMDQKFDQMDQKFNTLSGEFRAFREKQDEFVEFLKENVALKSELESGLLEVRTGLRSEILTVADQVTKLQETVEIELVAPTRRIDRLERRVTVVERKLGLAT